MSQENVEIVRSIYKAWAEERSARDLIHQDVEYVNPPDAVEPGTRRGRGAFRGITDAYEEVKVVPLEYIDIGGDDVVVIAQVTGRGRGSGFPMEWRHGYIWTVQNGVCTRFRWFNDPAQALEAVGLSE